MAVETTDICDTLETPDTPDARAPENTAPEPIDRRLLRAFLGGTDLEPLAGSLGISLEQMGDWARDRTFFSRLSGLRFLADMRGQLVVSGQRVCAANRLARMLHEEEPVSEAVRRLCADLMRTNFVKAPVPPAIELQEPAPENQERMEEFDREVRTNVCECSTSATAMRAGR